MAEYNNIVPNVQAWPKTLQRNDHFLMDYYGLQDDFSAVISYAESNPAAAVGQIVYAKADDLVAGKKAGFYYIKSYGEGAEVEPLGNGGGSIVAASYDDLVNACNGNNTGAIVVLTSQVDNPEDSEHPYKAGLYVVGAGNTIASLKSLSTSAADGTSVEAQVSAIDTRVGTLETTIGNGTSGLVKEVAEQGAAIDTLVGDDADKSVREIAAEELAKQLVPENAEESLNTLQKIADWIQSHPDDAADMNTAITDLQAAVGKPADGEDDATGIYADIAALQSKIGEDSVEDQIEDAIVAKIGAPAEGDTEATGIFADIAELSAKIGEDSVADQISAVIGTDDDTADDDTVKGAKAYADSLVADFTVKSVDGSNAIDVAGTDGALVVSLKIDSNEGNVHLSQTEDGLKGEMMWSNYSES